MKRTTLVYVLALSLIAVLAIGTHAVVDAVVQQMEDSAEVVNVSGRQRMLSQRIAGFSERLADLPDGAEATQVRTALAQAVDLMAQSHEALMAPLSREAGRRSLDGDPIVEIYRGDAHRLDRRVRDYVDAARALMALPAGQRASSASLDHLRREAERPLLASLDAAVTAYQQRSEQQVAQLRMILFAMLGAMLLALILEALTIFRPLIVRLERETERAVTANAQKTAFLANMSHEIRTPLGGMIGLTDLILEAPGQAKTLEYARRLREAGRHLLSVVNDILDFTKIAAGKVNLDPAPFRVANLAEAVQATFGPTAEQKGLRLRLDCPTDRRIIGDEFRLRQIIFNLIGNALKATAAGEVALRIEVAADGGSGDAPALLTVEVTDTGSGLSEEMLAKVFEPYVQARQEDAAKGSGLGLVICRDLVQAMGGEIDVKSTPGRGSTFTFAVPVGPVETVDEPVPATVAPEAPQRRAVAPGTRILVADDDELNRMLIDAAMTKLGYHVTTVADGRAALEAARAAAFDAIILDIQMPVMDGLKAQKAIREEGLSRGKPVVAITADVVPENVERYLAEGFDACLSKPFEWDAIDLAIRGTA